MAWVLTALYALLIAPVRAGIVIRAGGGQAAGAAGVMIWGLRAQAPLMLQRDAEYGLRLLLRGKPLSPGRGFGTKGVSGALTAFRRVFEAGSAVRRGVRLRALEITVIAGGPDAAHIALLTGLLNALGGALPRLRLRCRPAFGGKSAVQARCIAEARLGTLLAACLLGGISLLRAGRKEGSSWIIPSGT